MANKREYDYEKLVKCIAEKNLSSEHFSDLRGIEHGDYLKTIELFLQTLQELQQKHYKHNDLIREVEEYISLDKMVSKEQNIYKEKGRLMENMISELGTSVLELTLMYTKKISELAGKFEDLEDIYSLQNIKSELSKVLQDKKETMKVIFTNKKQLDSLQKKFHLLQTEMPNLKDIFDENAENEKIKSYGDLASNRKRLSDISQSYMELSKKIENLKQ